MSKSLKGRAKDGDMSKIDAREHRHRAEFEAAGGIHGTKMRGILWLINAWHTRPRPDLVENFLKAIELLHLMALPEHRHGVAGAIVAMIGSLPKREQAAYRGMSMNELNPTAALDAGELTPEGGVPTGKAPFAPLINSAHKLAIPVDDVLDLRPGHIDFLWMQWLVSRDDMLLNRLVRLTTGHPNLEVRTQGTILLRAHVHLPPVADRLRAVQALLGATVNRIPPNVPKAEVDELGAFLVKGGVLTPGTAPVQGVGLNTIILVGWRPGEDGGFFVVTPDGERPPNCPDKWKQRPLTVEKATAEQMEQHRAVLSARDEP